MLLRAAFFFTCAELMVFLLTMSCKNSDTGSALHKPLPDHFDIQGHRGARGLMPENTIPGFIHAMDLGVTTLEMDLAVSGDKEVVVSHEPWFSAEFSSRPNMDIVLPVEEESLLLYEMPYSEIRRYDVGRRGHRSFPRQARLSVCKPLLREVLDTCEKYWRARNYAPVRYNIEIKSQPDWDNWRTPPVNEFCQLVLDVLRPFNLGPRVTIQSFDPRALKFCHENDPTIPLAFLSAQGHTPEQVEQILGFQPQIYSPRWQTLTEESVRAFKQKGYLIIPWTVNDTTDLRRVMNMEVDGLITDYPDVALELAGRKRARPKPGP